VKDRSQIKVKVYSRAIVAIILITAWSLVTLSGLVLWLAPSGTRSGRQLLLLGLTKSEWNDVHFWIAVIAILVTIVHIVIDWKALRGVIRYMVSAHREKQAL
jgi:cytochrome b subunit of formate dehydrogenase